MLEVNVHSIGDPGAFDLSKGDPMYWTERFSYECSKMLYDMNTAGFKIRQATTTDLSDLETLLATFQSDVEDWFDDAVTALQGGLPVPVPPSLPTLPDWLSFEIIALIGKIIVNLILKWIGKKIDPDVDIGSLVDILRKGLVGEVGGTEYSFIELLQNTPLVIRVTNKGEYEDIEYRSD